MIAFPNAKINLGLHVLRNRSDGYHDIETVFYPVQWRDALEIVKAKKKENFKITRTGLAIDVAEENDLCAKAWRLMRERFDVPVVHIHLHKVIPREAGLGGGSSDAAFTIKLIDDLFKINLKNEELEDIASEIGSDCAFFIQNKPVLATGRGNIFSPVDVDLSNYKLIIVKPPVSVNTAEAYSKVVFHENHNLSEVIKLKPEFWKGKLINDFEKTVFKIYPEIEKIKDELYNTGAIYASMSGSGSAVYGLFKAETNLNEIKFNECKVWVGEGWIGNKRH
jgi:4-diphosphocytidyl-2-C-methyl-D-erythritol kinase